LSGTNISTGCPRCGLSGLLIRLRLQQGILVTATVDHEQQITPLHGLVIRHRHFRH
jgi:hypothetical protein